MLSYVVKNKSYLAFLVATLLIALACGYTLNTPLNTVFKTIFLFLLPTLSTVGACRGFLKVKESGGVYVSLLTRAMFWTSLGVFTWGFGQVVWGGYVFLKIKDVPYPSWADLFFSLAYPCWLIGLNHLMKFLKEDRQATTEINPILSLLFVVIVTNCIVISITKSQLSRTNFLDLLYPQSSAILVIATISVTISYIVTHDKIKAVYKRAAFIFLTGFVFQFLGDLLFTIRTQHNSYYNGDIADMCFVLSMFFISLALYNLPLIPQKQSTADTEMADQGYGSLLKPSPKATASGIPS